MGFFFFFKPHKIHLLAPCNEASKKTNIRHFCIVVSLSWFEEGYHHTGGAGKEPNTQSSLPFFGYEWKFYLLALWL